MNPTKKPTIAATWMPVAAAAASKGPRTTSMWTMCAHREKFISGCAQPRKIRTDQIRCHPPIKTAPTCPALFGSVCIYKNELLIPEVYTLLPPRKRFCDILVSNPIPLGHRKKTAVAVFLQTAVGRSVPVSVGCSPCKPIVRPRVSALIHEDLELTPDAVATARKRRAVCSARADPLDLVVPDRTGTFLLAVPLVVYPRVIGWIRPAFVVAAIPLRIPLHHDLIVRIGRVAEVCAVEIAVDAVGKPVEDTRRLVVSILVEAGGSNSRSAEQCHPKDRRNEPGIFYRFIHRFNILMLMARLYSPMPYGQGAELDTFPKPLGFKKVPNTISCDTLSCFPHSGSFECAM